jgi:hypothetical protein
VNSKHNKTTPQTNTTPNPKLQHTNTTHHQRALHKKSHVATLSYIKQPCVAVSSSNMQLTQSNPFEEPATSTTEDALFQPREIPRDLPAYSPTSTSRRGEILTRVKKYLVNGGFDMK